MTDTPSEDVHDAAEHSRAVAEAMRHLADQQYDRAERLRAAARQTFLWVSALFTVTQVVALSAFGEDKITPGEQQSLMWIAIVGASFLLVTLLLTIGTDRLRKVADIAPDDLVRAADDAVESGDHFGDALVAMYHLTATRRAEAVKERREWLYSVTVFAAITVTVLVGEIVYALIIRLH